MKVYQAINKVQASLCKEGITKSMRNNQGAGYNFRGIDQVYNALSPLLAEHGLCILPRVIKSEQTERMSAKGGTLIYSYVTMEFDMVAAEDGSKHTICTVGEAFDSGDKSMNKAMSAAYKYAAFQAFAIPTEGDNDADAHTHQVAPVIVTPTKGAADDLPADVMEFLRDMAMELIDMCKQGKPREAYERVLAESLDADQHTALWTLLPSNVRSAIKTAKITPL